MRRAFLTNYKKPSFLGFFCMLFFSACSSSSSCLSTNEIQVVATIPENVMNVKTGEKVPAGTTKSFGIFLEKNMVLTVSHAYPPTTQLSYFSVLKNDEKNELLLLKSTTCGTPISFAEKNAQTQERIFWCKNGQEIGKISKENQHTVADFSPLGGTKKLENLQKIYGDFSRGDSGKGLCNAKKEGVGILVSVDKEGAFLIPAEKIIDFLHEFNENALAF